MKMTLLSVVATLLMPQTENHDGSVEGMCGTKMALV